MNDEPQACPYCTHPCHLGECSADCPCLTYDPKQRAAEKQAARDEDARALANGEVTVEELRQRNGLIRGKFKIRNFR